MSLGKLQGVIVKTFLPPYESNIKAGLWLRGPGADSRVDSAGALAESRLSRGTSSMAHGFYRVFFSLSSVTRKRTSCVWIYLPIESEFQERGLTHL